MYGGTVLGRHSSPWISATFFAVYNAPIATPMLQWTLRKEDYYQGGAVDASRLIAM
jgi:hypothetical protein